MPNLFPPSPLARAAIRSGVPFLRAGLDDDQAVELLDEIADAGCELRAEMVVHLVDDMGGADLWTVIAHPSWCPCPLPTIRAGRDFYCEHGYTP